MRDLTKQERGAIEAVARLFSATREAGDDTADGYLVVAGKRAAVDIGILKRRGAGQGDEAKPRLRFDKVVIRLMERLKASLEETVPDGMTVVVAVTAPIRLPGKTADSLEVKIQTLLRRGSAGRDERDTIHGNDIRIRLIRHVSERAPKVIGFVHNPETDPLLLLNMTGELMELVNAEAGKPKPAGDRWLTVISARGTSCFEAYRYIYSQLGVPGDYKKVLMIAGEGSVGELAG